MSRSRQERRRQERKQVKNGPPSRPTGWWYPYALAATAAALAGLVYRGVLNNPFVYDDRMTVVGNPSIQDLGRPLMILMHDIFRPVVNLSYAIDFARSGLDPAGYHVTNILLHMVNVALLFFVVSRLIGDLDARSGNGPRPPALRLGAAFAGASIFAVHPVMTEAVGYVSGRSELLCTTFFLAAFLALRAFLLDGGAGRLAAGLVLFAFGAGSKETAAMLPFILLAFDLLLVGEDGRRRRITLFHAPFLAVIMIAGLVRVGVFLGVEQGSGGVGIWHNALTEVGVVWRYAWLLLVPVGQSIMHSVATVTTIADPRAALAILGLAGLAVALWVGRRRAPLVVFGTLWFLLLLTPAHLIPLQEAMAEHRVYAAGCGLFLALGGGAFAILDRLRERSRAPAITAVALLALLLAGLSLATAARNRVWSDPVRLWADAAAKAPSTWGAHYAHGDALRAAGRCGEAVDAYERAVEFIPDLLPAHLNRGICLAELGRFDEAIAAFSTARDVDPSNPQPHNNLGTLAARQGRLDDARDNFLEAIRLDPNNVRARLALARMNETVFDNPARALELCREALAIEPRAAAAADCVARNRARLEGSAPQS